MMQSTSRLITGRRAGTLALTLLAGSLLAACSHLPSAGSAGQASKQAAETAGSEVTAAVASPQQAAHREMRTVSTVTMSCVPTKDAQAAGLHQTEEVEAVYRVAVDDKLDDSEVALRFANRQYVLQQAPAASGSRYVTTEPLAKAHRGFSWHTKRNEAIIAAIESGSGVEDVVDGPLLYRCLAVN
ncbi:MAG: MliC family protein [Lautropia sp.]|nr:MliC family protein [Lautropia sp.]